MGMYPPSRFACGMHLDLDRSQWSKLGRDGDTSHKILSFLQLVLNSSQEHHWLDCDLWQWLGKSQNSNLTRALILFSVFVLAYLFPPITSASPRRTHEQSWSYASDWKQQQMWWEEGRWFQQVWLGGLDEKRRRRRSSDDSELESKWLKMFQRLKLQWRVLWWVMGVKGCWLETWLIKCYSFSSLVLGEKWLYILLSRPGLNMCLVLLMVAHQPKPMHWSCYIACKILWTVSSITVQQMHEKALTGHI